VNAWALLGTAVAGLVLFVGEWLQLRQAQATGAQLQAGKTDAATAAAETAIAQAEADAPRTRAAVVDQLKQGTF
jgi:hypothetical protein